MTTAEVDSLEKLSTTLGLVYESSLNPNSWPLALEALCQELNADKALILYMHPDDLTFSFVSGYGFNPYMHDIGAGRFRRYLPTDPVSLYAMEHVNEVFSDRRVIDPEVLHKSPMQIDIRDPADMEFLLTVYITEENIDGTVLIFFRGKNACAFTTDEEAVLTRYVPHIRRATKIHKALAGSQHMESLQSAVLNHLNWGVMVMDEEKKVLFCNELGGELIQKNSNVFIRNQRLVCLKREEQMRLNQSITCAIQPAGANDETRRVAVKIGDGQLESPLFMVITPLNTQKFEEKIENLPMGKVRFTSKLPNRRYALITFCAPDYKGDWSQMLRELFELTTAEAALVNKLAEDHSLKDAAQLLGRSAGTARVQLQSIFEKTGTNRQSSLVRLLMSIPS